MLFCRERQMLVGDVTHILRKMRMLSPITIRSAIIVVEEAINDFAELDACILELPAQKTVYQTRWVPGITRKELEKTLGLTKKTGYKWIVLDPAKTDEKAKPRRENLSITRIPLFNENEWVGYFSLLNLGATVKEDEVIPALGEVLSSVIVPYISAKSIKSSENQLENLKIELLEAARDEVMMRNVLLRMMEKTGAEFCAYYTEDTEGHLHVMLDSGELSIRISRIREKLVNTYHMFSNAPFRNDICREKVYLRSKEKNIAYLVGNSKIESYFLVPVTFDSRVCGTLFFGSVRDDAFVRENIEYFRDMAGDGKSSIPVVYRLSGELGILEKLVDRIPIACALISREGKILSSNAAFLSILKIDRDIPEELVEVDNIIPFRFSGIWSEFQLLGRNILGRELFSTDSPDSCLSIDLVHLDNLSKETGSLIMIRDVSDLLEKENASDEIMAIVAHEFRTPMTALRNSLKIMLDSGTGQVSATGNRGGKRGPGAVKFIHTAIRTIDRLNILANGLVDSSSIRLDDRTILPEDVRVKSFIEDASRLFFASIEKRNIDFRINVEHSVSTLTFDSQMMEQVIQNLLSNSLKHVVYGGNILIEVVPLDKLSGESIDVGCGFIDDGRFAEIRVRDSGPGFSEEILTFVNNPGKRQATRGKKVRGLGLYIVDKLIRVHGGRFFTGKSGGSGGSVHIQIPADRRTGEALRAVNSVRGHVERLISRGFSPLLYHFSKETGNCWLEIVEDWKIQPRIYPGPDGIRETGLYFWPVTEKFALALTLEPRSKDDPMFFINHGKGPLRLLDGKGTSQVTIGWTTYPTGGGTFTELLKNAVGKTIQETVKVN